MREFGVRITIAVEYEDHIGARDHLTVDFAEFVKAASLAEAAVVAAWEVPQKVSDHFGRADR